MLTEGYGFHCPFLDLVFLISKHLRESNLNHFNDVATQILNPWSEMNYTKQWIPSPAQFFSYAEC